MEDFHIDTRKISRPPSAPASPKFNPREDGLAVPDDIADRLGGARDDDDDDEAGNDANDSGRRHAA